MANAVAATRSADAVGAASDPQAQYHLRLAKQQIEEARGLMNSGNNKRADFLLVRAKADADLALAEAREGTIENDARAAVARVDMLRSQVNQAQATQPPPVGTTTTTGAPVQGPQQQPMYTPSPQTNTPSPQMNTPPAHLPESTPQAPHQGAVPGPHQR